MATPRKNTLKKAAPRKRTVVAPPPPPPVATQVKRPWTATLRTAIQMLTGLAAMLPLIVGASGLDNALPFVAGALAISAAVTRIMALPAVEHFLQSYAPGVAAQKAPDDSATDSDGGHVSAGYLTGLTLAVVGLVFACTLSLALGIFFAAIGVVVLFCNIDY